MLKVWGRRNSINVQKVLWLVSELALEHEHIPAGGAFGRLDEPAFLAMNPHGRIPVIEDGDVAVWESHAILRYLAARHPEGGLWPSGPAERARIDPWIEWAQASLLPGFGAVFWGFFRTPEAQRNGPAIRAGVRRLAEDFSVLDRHLAARPYIAGGEFSLADIPLGATLFRWFGMEIERPAVPNVVRWYERLQERPAYRAHVMLPFDDLRGRLAF